MKLFSSSSVRRGLALGLILLAGLRGFATTPALTQTLPAQTLEQSGSAMAVDLRNHFGLPGVTGQLVQFDTVLGKFNVELLAAAAPISVENFLGYVNRGNYSNSIIHRSVPGFVIQGGGFYANVNLSSVPAQAPIVLEYNLPNERGTLSMARTNTLNSATSQWFISTVDNTATLGQSNAGGYAVFGRVLGTGMSVVDAIAAVPVYTLGSEPFTQLPLRNPQATVANLVALPSITAISTYPSGGGTSALSFFIDNSNPSVVSADLSDSNLTLSPGSSAGSATITVTATDTNGNTASGSLEVTVNAVVQDQTIDFPAVADRTFGDAAFTLNASASSGLGVSFSIVSGPATISGNQLTLTGAGTVTVRASQGGDAGYHAASDVERTFAVNKATATVTVTNRNEIYDGAPKPVTVTTTPAGLNVSVTYTGPGAGDVSSVAPRNAGGYLVLAIIDDANYEGGGGGNLSIQRATPAITWVPPTPITYGTPLGAAQYNVTSTVPGTFTYSPGYGDWLPVTGSPTELRVSFTPTDTLNYNSASAKSSIVVTQAAAQIVLSNLTHTFDATPKLATVTTIPAGLAVTTTYNGAVNAYDAGSYAVVSTITNTNYVGSAQATLVIAKADTTIDFPTLPDVAASVPGILVNAQVMPAIGSALLSVVSGPAQVTGNFVQFTGVGAITLRASYPGSANFNAAVPVERTFSVIPTVSFAAWLAEKFTEAELGNAAVSGPSADPDLDGFGNLVEYALGLEPKSASTANLPEVATTATDWTYAYTRPAARADLVYSVEVSTNLTTWATANVTHELVSSDDVAGTQTWRARYPLASAANVFFRLKVTQ